jgi:peroxin-14
MAVREDLIEGAITFLQDPSVASAPIDQKVAFLRSKNLTQEEIDASLSRVGQSPPSQSTQQPANYAPQQQYRQPQQYYNNGYQQQQYWSQPPPEVPRRDWRDWFIMATVVSGVGYAAYWTAKRYILPVISPPTPPQLEQDKASIDASFDKAFEMLEQLGKDTQELKDAEKARTERLDAALSEVEAVVTRLKEANEEREREAKNMARELGEVREAIPKALERERKNADERLSELTTEMKSLKTLVSNRMQAPPSAAQPQQPVQHQMYRGHTASHTAQPSTVNGSHDIPAATAPETNGTLAETEKPASVLPERSMSGSPYGRTLGGTGKAQIPAWQLAAKKRTEEAKKDLGSESGTSTPVEPKPAEVQDEDTVS